MASFYGGKKGQDFSPTKTYNTMASAWNDKDNISSVDLILIDYGITNYNDNFSTDKEVFSGTLWKKIINSTDGIIAGEKEYYDGDSNTILSNDNKLDKDKTYFQLVSKISVQLPIKFNQAARYKDGRDIESIIQSEDFNNKYEKIESNTFIPITIIKEGQTLAYLVYRISPDNDWVYFLLFDGTIDGIVNTQTINILTNGWQLVNKDKDIWYYEKALTGAFNQNGNVQIFLNPNPDSISRDLVAYNKIMQVKLENGSLKLYAYTQPDNFQINVIY